jgi:hypothetical protein
LLGGLRRGGVEALELDRALRGEAVDIAELQDTKLEAAPEIFEGARAAGLELGLARPLPVVVGQAEAFAGAQVDERVDAGFEVVEIALEAGEAVRVVGIGLEPVDPARVRETVEQALEQVARELVEPPCRSKRVQGPQDDRHQACHGGYYPPGLAHAAKIVLFHTVGV